MTTREKMKKLRKDRNISLERMSEWTDVSVGLLNSVENKADLQKFGLFQETYNYNEDVTNNLAEAKKLLKSVENEATIVVNNSNECISGRFIKVYEPVNNFEGTFEIQTDNHVIGTDNVMTLEIKLVEGA